MKRINKVAILGAGTMGARIAAHFANAGVPSYLFDIVPPDADGPARNKIAAAGLDAARKSKPAAFMDPSLARFVTVGNFEDDLKKLADVDWIIEAVVENLEIKRALLRKVEAIRKPGTIVTTNTSGLPVGKIAEGFSDDFRWAWFGTHFFNPPRYMRLLEIIPTPEADRAAIDAITHFCDVRLGKGVVIAKDTPNFIGNRIGTFSVLNVMRLMQEMGLTIEEVDALTGQAVGWPKSATFRTIDLVGLDILGHVVGNMTTNVHDERSDLQLPEFFNQMLQKKWLGDKTKGGFYKKNVGRAPTPAGSGQQDERLALDWKTLEYHPRQKPKFAALDMAKIHRRHRRAPAHAAGPRWQRPAEGRQSRSLSLGGPLRSLDLFRQSRPGNLRLRRRDRSRHAPRLQLGTRPLRTVGRGGSGSDRRPHEERRQARSGQRREPARLRTKVVVHRRPTIAHRGASTGNWERKAGNRIKVPAGVWSATVAKKSNGVVKKNSGASLVDLGDGVGCIEFHSKMNSLGADIITLIIQTLKPGGPGDAFDAFVITNDATNFSVGANLMLLLMSVQEEEWDDVDLAIRQFQGMTQAIKFSPKPVVSAPFGLCLGGGTEISLHAAARQPHAELYTGLVEVGVGLLPGGGGCKEMLLRAVDSAAASRGKVSGEALAGSVEMMEAMKKAFETIATAKVATSAHEARGLGFLSDSDRITMNRERVLSDAKARALELVRAGYEPPVPRTDIPAPGENLLAALKMGVHLMRQGDFITDYEVKLGGKIAEVLCGGNVTPGTPVSEQYILDLEREGFKSLCGEKKTQERIQFTLKTGKTLRN